MGQTTKSPFLASKKSFTCPWSWSNKDWESASNSSHLTSSPQLVISDPRKAGMTLGRFFFSHIIYCILSIQSTCGCLVLGFFRSFESNSLFRWVSSNLYTHYTPITSSYTYPSHSLLEQPKYRCLVMKITLLHLKVIFLRGGFPYQKHHLMWGQGFASATPSSSRCTPRCFWRWAGTLDVPLFGKPPVQAWKRGENCQWFRTEVRKWWNHDVRINNLSTQVVRMIRIYTNGTVSPIITGFWGACSLKNRESWHLQLQSSQPALSVKPSCLMIVRSVMRVARCIIYGSRLKGIHGFRFQCYTSIEF